MTQITVVGVRGANGLNWIEMHIAEGNVARKDIRIG